MPAMNMLSDRRPMGNFNENRLDEINEKRNEIGFLERSLKLKKECRECKYYSICRGGCQRNRDLILPDGQYENYFCQSYRMFFDACLGRMEEIAHSGS